MAGLQQQGSSTITHNTVSQVDSSFAHTLFRKSESTSKKLTKTKHRNNFFFKQKLRKRTYLTTSILSMRSLAVSNALTPTTGTAKPG